MEEHEKAQRSDAAETLQAAYDNDELFEKIIEMFPYPMQVFSPDGTAVRINRAAQDVLGIRLENHIGKGALDADDMAKGYTLIRKISVENGVATGEKF